MKSYIAKYWANDRHTLIGGVMRSQSSRYQTMAMARARLEIVRDLHPGRDLGSEVVTSSRHPEIFIHCGTVATAVGCRCPGCGKELSRADAQAAAEGV